MKRYRMVLGIAIFAFAAFLVGQAAPNGCITPEQIYPQGDGSGLDADMVDGLHAAALQKTIFSYYEEVVGTGNENDTITYSILTVPVGKTAVVTDIRISRCCGEDIPSSVYLSVLEDSTTKYRSQFNNPDLYRIQEFSTGIPIQSGSELSVVVVYGGLTGTATNPFMDLFVGGYLIDAAS